MLHIGGWGAAWSAGSLAAEQRGVMPLRGRGVTGPQPAGAMGDTAAAIIQLFVQSSIGFARQGGG